MWTLAIHWEKKLKEVSYHGRQNLLQRETENGRRF
jgi:hypothetical protein